MSSHLLLHYNQWRYTRVTKLENVLGKNFFPYKTILEVGAGHGRIGKYFRESYGCRVDFTEARVSLVDEIRRLNPGADVFQVDHELYWNLDDRKYDLIIHWGLLYHIDRWEDDLICTRRHLKSGGILTLESETMDSDEDKEAKVLERSELDDQAVSGKGTRPSALRIENMLAKLDFKAVKRYDDSDLNTEFHKYDWVVGNTGGHGACTRRFWICYT